MADSVLWSGEKLKLSIGHQILLNDAAFSIAENERVALVGRNGSGKSSLMRITAGLDSPSEGDIFVRRNLRIAFMPQDFDIETDKTCREIVQEGLVYFQNLIKRYEMTSQNSPESIELERLLNYHNAWDTTNKLDVMMDKLHLPDTGVPFDHLSGGERRRVLLARTLIAEPELLLLDEPTNHLDVTTIAWIENFLADYRGACLFVTHDRYFLDRIATRIIELDHGKIYSYDGSYADFLEAKAAREYAEDLEASKRNAFLRREVEWVRRSPKARLKKNLGRVKRFDELAAIQAPERTGNMELVIPDPPRLGNKVVDLKDISLSLGERTLISHFNFEFNASDKVGIVGQNGTGKTCLLKMITGLMHPDSGIVTTADTVRFNYVDQTRLALNQDANVWEEVGGDSDYVSLGNGAKITVRAYLRRFLFEDERINTKVKYLSGGEKARLILAKILKNGGNFLILDEPTNDLDLPSLRVLEEALAQYPSTVVVVSHDRYFLNRVCNRIIGFIPGQSELRTSVGDYDYFLSKMHELEAKERQVDKAAEKTEKKSSPALAPTVKKKQKLSWSENKELEGMEDAILTAESKIQELEAVFSSPDFYSVHGHETAKLQEELNLAKAEAERLYARWEELEQKKASLEA